MIFFYETKTITFVLQKIIMTENLTKQTFLEKVFNYEKNKDWMYEGPSLANRLSATTTL